MTRLIDADALTLRSEMVLTRYGKGCLQEILAVRYEDIENAPTIDAVPVRHGKWIKADSQQYFRKHYPVFTCSECGQRKDSQKTWNYCPNCGADMRGEE